jgi:hypothetical protein
MPTQQQKVNSGPNGSFNKAEFDKLDSTGWIKMPDGKFNQIPSGSQVRYLVNKDGQVLFRSGGFMMNNNDDDVYFVLKGYSDARFSVQKANVVELWYKIVNRSRKTTKKTENPKK